jgi:histidine triad (HIT) family protein
MENCIFCAIVRGETGKIVWENDVAAAFETIAPQAPVHILVASKRHIENLDQLEDVELAGKLLLATSEVAHSVGIQGAWRLKVNNGAKAGQTIPHLHFHVLGGQDMAE